MPHTLVPVHIRPHLVSFLFREFKAQNHVYEGKKIKVAKLTTASPLGKVLRMYMEKTYKKPVCDKSSQIFLKVAEYVHPSGSIEYPDGRSCFLQLPKAGELFLNNYLELNFETALMYSIHSWSESKTGQGINEVIISFLEKYNLEEYNYTILGIRRDYYRKRRAGYFNPSVHFNPLSNTVEAVR